MKKYIGYNINDIEDELSKKKTTYEIVEQASDEDKGTILDVKKSGRKYVIYVSKGNRKSFILFIIFLLVGIFTVLLLIPSLSDFKGGRGSSTSNSLNNKIDVNKIHSVIFYDNNVIYEVREVKDGSIVLPENPTKEGYTFEGWVDEDGNDFSVDEAIKENEVIYSKYILNEYKIEYDLQGGKINKKNPTKYTIEDEIVINNPTKENYTFIGWEGTGLKKTTANLKISKQTGDLKFVAKYIPNTYNIIYVGNGDNVFGSMPNQGFNYDEKISLTNNNYSRIGYTFDGWNTKSDGTGIRYRNNEEVLNISDKDIVLYAMWNNNAYQISFNSNDINATGSMTNQTLYYDKTMKLSLNKYINTGYVFDSWNTKSDGTGTRFENGEGVINLSTDGTITLYAIWATTPYTINFDKNNNDATGIMNSIQKPYGIEFNLPENLFVRDKYDFIGWNTKSDGTGIHYDDKQKVKNLDIDGEITLYAEWKIAPDSVLVGGSIFKDRLGALVGTSAESFIRYNGTPDLNSINKVVVSTTDSLVPTYIWREGDIIYWWSEAKKPRILNAEDMFRTLTFTDTVDLSGFNANESISFVSMFNHSNVKNIIVGDLVSNPTVQSNMGYMFYNCGLESITFGPNFNTSKVIGMNYMFADNTKLTNLDISMFSSDILSDLHLMFNNDTNLESITFGPKFTLAMATKISNLFYNCSKLKDLDLSYMTFNNANDLSSMFEKASNLEHISFSENIDVSKVTNMNSMFNNTKKLESIDLSNFVTSSLISMSNMFRQSGIRTIDLSSFDVSHVINIYEFLWGCENLTTVDFSNWKLSINSSQGGVFYNSKNIATIYANEETDFSGSSQNLIVFQGMSTKLKGGAGTVWGDTLLSNARIDDPDNGKPGYFTLKDATYIKYDANGGTGTMTGGYVGEFDLLKSNTYTKDQYKFMGWNTQSDVKGTHYDDNDYGFKFENVSSITLYAEWKKLTATLIEGNNIWYGELMYHPTLKSFEHYEGTPDLENIDYKIISTNNSNFPVYLFYNETGKTAYWWSEAEHVWLNKQARQMFQGLQNIERIDLSGLDASNVTDFTNMFYSNSLLKDLTLPDNLDQARPTLLTNMFYQASSLKSLDLSDLNLNEVTDMSGMFYNMKYLENLKFSSNSTTDNLTLMNNTFYGCSSLKSLDLRALNTTKVTSMNGLFFNLSKLEEIILSDDFKTGSVTDMSNMLHGVNNMDVINMIVSKLDTSNVKKMDNMFSLSGTNTYLDLSHFDTSSLVSAKYMFYKSNYKSIDISSFGENDTASDWMFASMPNIETIYTNEYFENSLTGANIFYQDTNTLVGGAGTKDAGFEDDMARVDDPDNGKPGYFSLKDKRYIRYNANGGFGNMTSHYIAVGDHLKANAFVRIGYEFNGWNINSDGSSVSFDDNSIIYNIGDLSLPLTLYAIWDSTGASLVNGTSFNNILNTINPNATEFKKYSGTPDLDNINNKYNISNSSSLEPVYAWSEGDVIYWWSNAPKVVLSSESSKMFKDMKSLVSVDLKSFDTSKVTDMTSMFEGCNALETVDVSDINTSSLVSMNSMFKGCIQLSNLDLTKFNTSNVRDFGKTFYETGFFELDLSSFDTSSALNYSYMLSGMPNLVFIDLSGFDFQKWGSNFASLFNSVGEKFGYSSHPFTVVLNNTILPANLSRTFESNNVCNVQKVYLRNAKTVESSSFDYMFNNCTDLELVDFTGMDTSNVVSTNNMFNGSGVTNLDMSSLDFSKVTSMKNMFRSMLNLETLNISGWKTDNLKIATGMFNGDSKLNTIDTTNINVSNVTAMDLMFQGTTALEVIDLSNWDTKNVTNMRQLFAKSGVKTIYASDKFTTTKVTSYENIFNATNLVGGAGTIYSDAAKNDLSYARIDDIANDKPGFFTLKK